MNSYNYANEILKEHDQSNLQDNYKRVFTSGHEIQDEAIVVTKVENFTTVNITPACGESLKTDYNQS